MKVFVISLANSKDRRKSIKGQLESLKLDFEIVDAINGKELSSEEIRKFCDASALEENPRWLNLGAIGCALSHMLIYEKIIEQKLDGALILEDDMLLPNNLSLLSGKVAEVVNENEVVLFYYRGFKKILFSKKCSRRIDEEYQILYPVSEDNFPVTTGGYYITNKACKEMLKIILPIRVAADSWGYFYKEKGFDKISVLFPRPLKDANYKSDIDYLASYEGRLKSLISYNVDKFKVPFLYNFLKKRRNKREGEMSDFELVEDNPYFK